MKKIHFQCLLGSLLLSSFISGLALADDTEILTGQFDEALLGGPNILFVFDTSASMNSDVIVAEGYDPAITYTSERPAEDCDVSRVYWHETQAPTVVMPRCNGALYFNLDNFHCSTARTPLEEVGYYIDSFSAATQVGADVKWIELDQFGFISPELYDAPVECAADWERHGHNDFPALIYPYDPPGGIPFGSWSEEDSWTSDDSDPDRIDWDDHTQFTIFTGNYMNYLRWVQDNGETAVSDRMKVLKDKLKEVLLANSGLDINVGLQRFRSGGPGSGPVIQAVSPLIDNIDDILESLNSLSPAGTTPLTGTAYEGYLYLSGQDIEFGDDVSPATDPDAIAANGTAYQSPIEKECQKNFMVVLTDGQPNGDTAANGLIQGLNGGVACEGNCLDELTHHMAATDNAPGLEGQQTIETFTIGFFFDNELLLDAATAFDNDGNPDNDDDDYFLVTNANDIANAFQTIIGEVTAPSGSFVAPTISVNSSSRLFTFEDVYIALFEPSDNGQPHWRGNLKKYKLNIGENGAIKIVGQDGQLAIDDNGQFTPDAWGFWSGTADGSDITKGGMAQNLPANPIRRRIFTNLKPIEEGGNAYALSDLDNRFATVNERYLTPEKLQVDPAERDAVIHWGHALTDDGELPLDADGNIDRWIGDALHTSPLVIPYSIDGGLYEDGTNPDIVVVFGTNDGFLHAVDPNEFRPGVFEDEGLELFAFIPEDQLPDLKTLKDNTPRDVNTAFKEYGMDGALTLWIEGDDGDKVAENTLDERPIVFAGMRRGGRNYYALDMANRFQPNLLWTIQGGKDDTNPYYLLGDTWSAPMVAKIRAGNRDGERTVLLFGGGNSPNADVPTRAAAGYGNAVFMADAISGERLWMASSDAEADLPIAKMTHSIPSDLRILDMNRDGYVDRIYVVDNAAKLFRFDIDNYNLQPNGLPKITGGLIFDGSNEGGDERFVRRGYYPPSVARVADDFFGSHLAISYTTGNRAHPLERAGAGHDRAFSIRDPYVFVPPPLDGDGEPDYGKVMNGNGVLDLTDFADRTEDEINTLFTIGDEVPRGWTLRFRAAEKGLSSPIALENVLYFTTYLPLPEELNCDPKVVRAETYLYSVDLTRALPVIQDEEVGADDRYSQLGLGIPPPTPVFAFLPCPEGENCDVLDVDTNNDGIPDVASCPGQTSRVTMLVGTQVRDPNVCNIPQRTYWYQEGIGGP